MCLSVCAVCAGILGWQVEEETIRLPGARVTRGCELMGWELNPSGFLLQSHLSALVLLLPHSLEPGSHSVVLSGLKLTV